MRDKLARFLFAYRITPQSITGKSPAELMFGRQIRTRLQLLKPDISHHVMGKQEKQKQFRDHSRKDRLFEAVYTRNFGKGEKWFKGRVVELIGSAMVKVELEDHSIVRRHLDQTRRRKESSNDYPTVVSSQPIQQPPSTGDELVTEENTDGVTSHRYPSRNRKPPDHYY